MISKDINYIYFDVAHTLLNKEDVYTKMQNVLAQHNIKLPITHLKKMHKILSESTQFPDKTSAKFYRDFNQKLMIINGIVPTDKLLDDIFNALTYLPWSIFNDTKILTQLKVPIGVISNWDTTLKNKLTTFFPDVTFTNIIGSQEVGFQKPSDQIFDIAVKASGVNKNNILYIGDSIRLDYLPAQNYGLNTLLIDRENNFPYFNGNKISSLTELLKQ